MQSSEGQRERTKWARLRGNAHVRHSTFIVVAVTTAVLFFALGALLRVLVGPVSLSPLKGEISDSLNTALPGVAVRFDEAALEWSRDEGRINVAVLGARVYDSDGRIIAQAPKAEINLGAAAFLSGRLAVRSIALVGMQFTLVRTKAGRLRLGVTKDSTGADLLERISDAISARSTSASTLQKFSIRRARMAFYDEGTGLFVVAPRATLNLTTADAGKTGARLQLGIAAHVEVSGKPANVVANLDLPQNNAPLSGDISVTGLDLNALGRNSKWFAALEPLHLISEISGSFKVKGSSLLFADFGMSAKGSVAGFGQPVHVKSLRMVGRYDGATGRLLIDDATLEGNQAEAHMTGRGDISFDEQGVISKIALSLGMDQVKLDMPSELGSKIALSGAALQADYLPKDGRINIQRFSLDGGALSAHASGSVVLAGSQTPAIELRGSVAALSIQDLLKYWPLNAVDGVRDWVAPNITAGKIGPISFQTHIPAGALSLPQLPEDALNVSFAISDATVTYIDGLTPMTNVQANAVLTGDTFKTDLTAADIGPLKVTDSHAVIPNLHQAVVTGDITAHVQGAVSDVLKLIDLKPLQYPTRFHVDPLTTTGMADVTLNIRVPMVKDLKVDDVGIAIKAAVNNFAINLGESTHLTKGALNFDIDTDKLRATGAVNLGSARVNVDWTELFDASKKFTTKVLLNGSFDAAARDALNFHANDYLNGPVNVSAQLDGVRGKIKQAKMDMDLTPAEATLDLLNYKKASGVTANAHVTAAFSDSGDIKSETITLTGPGLDAQGSASFNDAGDIQTIDFPRMRAGPSNDFSFHLSDTPAGYTAKISGRSIDGGGIGRRSATDDSAPQPKKAEAPPPESNLPFNFSVHVDRLALRQNVVVSPFDFEVSGLGHRPNKMELSGVLGRQGKLEGRLTNTSKGRNIVVTAENAGLLAQGLFGFSSMKGGDLKIEVQLPSMAVGLSDIDPKTPDYTGTLSVSDFTIVDQPFLARLFAAGSLGGLIDLMGGKGVVISKLATPFAVRNNVITVHDARASGPSLGITADGYIDRPQNRIALKGTLAPIYGLNSVLGAIPLVGDVLVSKKGEGVFGMTYSVSGDADQPQISVNPLSVLAPGILRRIFEGKIPVEPQAQPGPSKKTPPASQNVQPSQNETAPLVKVPSTTAPGAAIPAPVTVNPLPKKAKPDAATPKAAQDVPPKDKTEPAPQ